MQEELSLYGSRLAEVDLPSVSEVLRYKRILPFDDDVPSFLKDLDTIIKSTGVKLDSVGIEEQPPETQDLLDKYLQSLQNNGTDTTNQGNGQATPPAGTPSADQQPTSPSGEQNPEEMLPFVRIPISLKIYANEEQLANVLTKIEAIPRAVYVSQVLLSSSKDENTGGLPSLPLDLTQTTPAPTPTIPSKLATIQLDIFYYKEDPQILKTP